MNYFAECLTRFQSLDTITRETFGSVETYASLKEVEDKYKLKLSFLIILLAINELEEGDIEDYLIIKFKLSPAVAKNVKEEIVDKILDPVFEKIINTKPINNFVASKEDIINLFSKRIIETLKASSDITKGLNVLIFKFLNDHDNLEEKIIELLYSNEEILTGGKLIIEDRTVASTISNWLKDFIKINGSEMFDELKMAEYLSSSVNAKKLKQPEKDLLRRLLKLYRNLVFFPDSMGNDPIEDWQIIPVDKIETNKKISRPGVFRDALDDSQPIISSAPSSFSAPLNKQKLENTPLNELQEALTQYAPGSLEHKAISQEISRIKRSEFKQSQKTDAKL